jgi:heat shock protein HtpX
MSPSSRRPRGLAILTGVWLLALAGVGLFIGSQLLVALFTGSSFWSVLLITGVLALVFGYLSYRLSTKRLLSRLNVAPLSQAHAPSIHESIARLSSRMSIDQPEVYLARLGHPNAFALGSGTLVIDRSLVRLLTPAELEGVLAHELAHLEGYDSLLRTLATSILRTVTTLMLVVFVPFVVVISIGCWGLSLVVGRPIRGPNSVGSGLRHGLNRLVMGLLVAPSLALQAYARRREYAADDRAVAVIDDPAAFARALEKIQRANDPGWGLFSWLLPNRERRKEQTRLERAFASHPPTDERVNRVREAANASGSSTGSGRWQHVDIN